MSLLVAQLGHAAVVGLCPLSRAERKPYARIELFRVWPRLCENALGRRMRRIVFSIVFFRKKSPVQSTSTSTKSRSKFYPKADMTGLASVYEVFKR